VSITLPLYCVKTKQKINRGGLQQKKQHHPTSIMSPGPTSDDDDKFTKTGKRKKHSIKKYLSTREMVTGVRKATNLPIQQPMVQASGDIRIYRPSKNDILCGRGKPIQDHTGNLRMRNIAAKYTDFYLNSRVHKKQEIVEEVVKLVKNSDGIVARFLKRVGRENYWVEVSDAVASNKVSHALRCIVRKGERICQQEELAFGRSTTSTSEAQDEARDMGQRREASANTDLKDGGRDLLLGVRSAATAATTDKAHASIFLPNGADQGHKNLQIAGGLQSLLSHRVGQPLVGHPLFTVPPGGALSGVGRLVPVPSRSTPTAPAGSSLLVGSLPASAVRNTAAAALAAHNERLIDMLAREQVQREMAHQRQQQQVPPFSEGAVGAISQQNIAAVNQALARMQALGTMILKGGGLNSNSHNR
jgi:hypothetical protein